jgi:hypothetical protein
LAAALPAINPHLHGHKRGSHVQSAEETSGGSGSTAQVPAGLQQNLFGSLLSSLEQAIGVQAATPASAATTASANGASSAAATGASSTAATGSAANPGSTAAQSSLTSLQNYLNNLLHNARIDGSAAAKLAGSNLNATA